MKTKQFLFACLAVIMCSLNISAKDYYVKTTGLSTNDGLSWSTPLSLDAALAIADEATDDVIHIAAGTYIPATLIASSTTGLTDRDKTFEIAKNISLIGGYPADATVGAEPTPRTHETILSGDLGGGVSAYHVMVITAPQFEGQKVSISGLTIRDGNGDGGNKDYVVSTTNGVTTIQGRAGGVYVVNSTVEMTDCDIVDNKSTQGAGLTLILYADVTLIRCNVERNNPTAQGGGIFLESAKADSETILTLYDCSTSNNLDASTGSGVYSVYPCQLYIYNSTISNNTTSGSGAGLYLRQGVKGFIINSTIHGNTSSSAKTTNRSGVHILAVADLPSTFDIINTTITANGGGGNCGVEVGLNSTCNIYNSIISGNFDATKEFKSNATTTVKNSIVSDSIYNNAGTIVSDVSFDKSTIGALSANGGFGNTCLISKEIGISNPALGGYGMTSSELESLASTYTPAIPSQIITSDQAGASREIFTTMGALLNPDLFVSTQTVKNKSFYVVSHVGLLSVVPTTADQLSIYSISGVKVFSKVIVDKTDISLPSGVYLVKIGNEVTRAIVK